MPATQRGYWGCATPANRAIWFYVILALATGITLAVVGGIKRANCTDNYNSCVENPTRVPSLEAAIAVDTRNNFCWQKYHDDCHYVTYSILLWIGVVLCIKAPFLMLYFCCRSRPPTAHDGSATVTVTAAKAQGYPVANPAYGTQPLKV